MILSISWKNIWRSKTRSSVILIAIALGITAGVFNMGFYYGMIDQRIETAINTESSHIQVHDSGYLTNPDIKLYFENTGEIKDRIDSLPGVKAVSNRILVNSMALTAESGAGVRVAGIDPAEEKRVTNIYSKLVQGDYFKSDVRQPILIGEELAIKLDVDKGNKIILHLQTVDGTMTRGRFRIVGVFRTSNAQFDERNVFVERSDLAAMIGLDPGKAHETAILLEENDLVEPVKEEIAAMLPDLSVKPWHEIMPEVSLIEESMDITMYFIMLIILLALCFGIINTMLMAVLERVKEIGMLKAIGMNKVRIFSMIMTETVLLALTGGVAGLGLGYLTIIITGRTGIDLSIYNQAWQELGYESVIYPTIEILNLVIVTMLVVATGIIASIYPAIKANKLSPAEALKTDV